MLPYPHAIDASIPHCEPQKGILLRTAALHSLSAASVSAKLRVKNPIPWNGIGLHQPHLTSLSTHVYSVLQVTIPRGACSSL
jgi:hypothetical protein